MKTSGIISIVFGVFLIAIAIGIFQSIPSCKDGDDIVLYILMMLCSGFSGACFIAAGIADWNKVK